MARAPIGSLPSGSAASRGCARSGRARRVQLDATDTETDLDDPWDVDGDLEDTWGGGGDGDDAVPTQEELKQQYTLQQAAEQHGISPEVEALYKKLVEHAAENQDENGDPEYREDLVDEIRRLEGRTSPKGEMDLDALFGQVGGAMEQEKFADVVLNDTWVITVSQQAGGGNFLNLIRRESELTPQVIEDFNSGETIYPTAVIMARWLAIWPRPPVKLTGKTIIELGAGCGLPGLTAALLGAERVLFTDRSEGPLRDVVSSAVMNNFADRVWTLTGDWNDLHSRLLEEEADSPLLPFLMPDIILSSFILFDEAHGVEIAELLGKFLQTPDQVAYFVEYYRQVNTRAFKKACTDAGLNVKEDEIVTWEPEQNNPMEADQEWFTVLFTVSKPT